MRSCIACLVAGRTVPPNQRAWIRTILQRLTGGNVEWSLLVDCLDASPDCILVAGPTPFLSKAWPYAASIDWSSSTESVRPFGIWFDHPSTSATNVGNSYRWLPTMDVRIGFDSIPNTIWIPNWLRLLEHRLSDPAMKTADGVRGRELKAGTDAASKNGSTSSTERSLIDGLLSIIPKPILTIEDDDDDDDDDDGTVSAIDAELRKKSDQADAEPIPDSVIRSVIETIWYSNLSSVPAWSAAKTAWNRWMTANDRRIADRRTVLRNRIGLSSSIDLPTDRPDSSTDPVSRLLFLRRRPMSKSMAWLSSMLSTFAEIGPLTITIDDLRSTVFDVPPLLQIVVDYAADVPIPTAVINLDRRPDRWLDFQRLLALFPSGLLDIRRLSAIDGRSSFLERRIPKPFPFSDSLPYGAVGCWLTHLAAWTNLSHKKHPADSTVAIDSDWSVLFEDDIVPMPTFYRDLSAVRSLLTETTIDADIIWLGTHMPPVPRCRELATVGRYPSLSRLTTVEASIGGSFGYLISKTGATKLLRRFSDETMIDVGVDTWMMRHSYTNQLAIHPTVVFSQYVLPDDPSTHRSDCAT